MDLIKDAVAKGAKIELGGGIPKDQPIGWFLEPTILTGCTSDMHVLHRETFGPLAAIIRVADFEQALSMANASEFGLGACLYTSSLEEAMEGINRLQAGMVWVNNPLVDNDALPFGGIKSSGIGRALGRHGLDAFRRPKMVVLDHKARAADWWYPYPDDWFYQGGSGGGRKHS
jgi:acyl-CoA reductase-like NAD-dependent aldehyde dehydrogenase